MGKQVVKISSKTALDFLMPKHYAGRKPQISEAFGWYVDDVLVAVITYGKPASPSLCEGVCGKENSKYVYELNRLCRIDNLDLQLSEFVAKTLNILKDNNWIIVSYSDTGMHHNGYIYQACNFLYTGKTKQRTDKWTPNGKHSRHYNNNEQGEYRKVRTAKNRYIYFCCHSKTQKKKWLKELKYPICEYPKEKNINYVLGQYQKDILVKQV